MNFTRSDFLQNPYFRVCSALFRFAEKNSEQIRRFEIKDLECELTSTNNKCKKNLEKM